MIYISKAPLRIGLAGGGTDVSPYSDMFGGAILNATINLFASAALIPGMITKSLFTPGIKKSEKSLHWRKNWNWWMAYSSKLASTTALSKIT
jgi:galactokinase/mevalonate kinase-like predicted kinase